MFFFGGYCEPLAGDKGLALPSADEWLPNSLADFWAGLAGSAVTVVLMLLLNKVFNVLRSMTWLYIAFFAVMQLATPALFTQFYTGTMLAIAVPLCLLFLFSCYREPSATRHVFVIFLLLSFLTATQYCYAAYALVFIIGLAQMRILNARSIVAAFMGAVTPWWIMFGFGIISPEELRMPSFVSIFSVIDYDEMFMLLVTLGVTVFVTLLCFVLNFLKTIAYNARARAVNGTFTVLTLVTVACMCVDYRNIISYVPMLNFCGAMELTHYFSTHRAEKSSVAVLTIIAVYAALFVCQTVI